MFVLAPEPVPTEQREFLPLCPGGQSVLHCAPLPSPQFCEGFLHQGPSLLCVVQLVTPFPPAFIHQMFAKCLCWALGILYMSKTGVGPLLEH